MQKLSANEKQSMRVHLYKVMEESSALLPEQKIAPTPVRGVPSMYHWFSPRFSVPIAVLLVVGLSGGTAFAAQSALPGEPLYAVKINVNEPVQIALATTPEAKAEVNASIATTRLEEAETLASTGALNATTTAELASNFAAHANAAETDTDVLEQADPSAAAQLGAEFEGTLAAHSAILAQLGSDSSSTETMQNSNTLAVQVAAQSNNDVLAVATVAPATVPQMRTFAAVAPHISAPSASNAATSTLGSQSAPANPDDGTVALGLQSEASSTLADLQTHLTALEPSLSASTTAQIDAQVQIIQTMYGQGSDALTAGDNASAKNYFSRALRASVRLDAFISAGKKFNPQLLSSLLFSMGINQPQGKRAAGISNVFPQVDIEVNTSTTTVEGDGSVDTQTTKSADVQSSVTSSDSSNGDSSVSASSVNISATSQVNVQLGQ